MTKASQLIKAELEFEPLSQWFSNYLVSDTFVLLKLTEGKSRETEIILMVARGWGKDRKGSECLTGMEFPFEVKKMF